MTIETIAPYTKELVDSESSIFNYMTSEVFLDSVLKDNRIRFKNLTKTNDPYEYTHIKGYSAPYSDKMDQSEQDFCMKTVREISRLRNRMCIGCFCYNEDDSLGSFNQESGELYNAQSGYQHSRMWSQYGEDHKGVCLLFDKNVLVNELKSKFSNKEVYAEKVVYKQSQIIFPDYEDLESFRFLEPQEAAMQYISKGKNNIKTLFTKDIDYEREKEFRIAFYSDNDFEYASLKALKAIILGHRFSKNKEACISRASASLGIVVLKNNYLGNSSYLTHFEISNITSLEIGAK